MKTIFSLRFLSVFLLLSLPQAFAGLHPVSVSAGNVPWPGGVVPYVFDASLSAARKQAYLDGLREWELAANVHFIPRTSQTQYILCKYSPTGPNLVSGTNPVTVEINLLTRGQVCHEVGHALGLEHEHQRPNRDSFVTVLYGNVSSGNSGAFDILPASVPFGSYDFESVMHYGRNVYATGPGLDTIQTKPGFEKYQRRLANYALSPTDRAHLASLYGAPVVPLSAVVTTTADTGTGSLRAAIYYSQDHPGTTVTFNIPPSDPGYAAGVFTIKPTGHLPPLATNGLTIDATGQPGYGGSPVVFLDGSSLIPEVGEIPCFLFYESNCMVKGLGIVRYPWTGVAMLYSDATGNRVVGCNIGIDAGGSATANSYYGAYLAEGAHGNVIGGAGPNERNVISGNTLYGVYITGSATTANTVQGNYIGTNLTGTASVTNSFGGIILIGGAHHNTIGGTSPAARNVISGNSPLPPAFNSAGVWITGGGTNSNTIAGNYIGTNAAGTAAVPNQSAGVYIVSGASDNTVTGNVLSGNTSEGLRIADSGTTGNKVYGNIAGLNAAGSSTIPNGFAGITVLYGASGNQVGGALPGQGNVMSGNNTVGLAIGAVGTTGNFAFGNFIGTDPTGAFARPNGFSGVYLTGGCSGNYLGDGPGSGNLISANNSVGVFVGDAGTTGNFIRNNRIGPASGGGITSPQQGDGIWILGSAQISTTGGSGAGHANVITGNSGSGIVLYPPQEEVPALPPTIRHTFQRNSIFGNGFASVYLSTGTNHDQPAPVVSSAILGTATTVGGTLSGSAGTTFTLEFFSGSTDANAGHTFIGTTTATTNGSGAASFNVALPAIVKTGYRVTATATSQATGDTSAYSNPVAVTTTDTDSDGMPNAYENATPGLNSANGADAALDNDGDGFSNLQEFFAGTNPNNSGSSLLATGVISGGGYQVLFASVNGKSYRLEASSTLTGVWETLAVNIAGTGGNVAVSLPLAPSVSKRFYRVAVEN